MDQESAHRVFEVVTRRYERGSGVLTSNRGFAEWDGVLGANSSFPSRHVRSKSGLQSADDPQRMGRQLLGIVSGNTMAA